MGSIYATVSQKAKLCLGSQSELSWSKSVASAWYAVYTKHQHDKSAAALLGRKDFEVFFPVYRAVHRWKDRNQIVVLPLFPCYLFLRTELDRKIDILRTVGVRWIVENAGHACPVPEAEIEAVRKICSAATRVQPHPFLKHGDLVRIRRGPLLGMEGFLVRIKNQCRVVVSVDLLQKSVAVEVDVEDVGLVNPVWNPARNAAPIAQKSA